MSKFWKAFGCFCWVWLTSITIAMAAPLPPDSAAPSASEILHLLNRTSLGPTALEMAQVERLGINRYLEQQLNPDSIAESKAVTQRLAKLETLNLSQTELSKSYSLPPKRRAAGQGAVNRKFVRQVLRDAYEARLVRAIASSHSLQEVMVDFWFNHFNVYGNKGRTKIWVGSYEQNAIRPHALGKFRDLLGATARHPAMLFYLDNWRNTAPDSPGVRQQFQGFNENYARELMELHSLGVDGGYTQADVESLTRILTGWSLQPNVDPEQRKESFQFAPGRHDFSDKVFLGHQIPGSGQAEVEQALDILASHPATAHYVSYRLAQYFVADQPPTRLVDELAQVFTLSGGDIREVLTVLFHSPEFWSPQFRSAKFKTPYQFVVSTMRLTGIQPKDMQFFQKVLKQQLGMPLFGCPTPDGYGNQRQDWLNPDGLERRLDFATMFARRQKLQGQADELLTLLGENLSSETQAAIQASPPRLRTALVLGSPELMWR